MKSHIIGKPTSFCMIVNTVIHVNVCIYTPHTHAYKHVHSMYTQREKELYKVFSTALPVIITEWICRDLLFPF